MKNLLLLAVLLTACSTPKEEVIVSEPTKDTVEVQKVAEIAADSIKKDS